MHVESTTSVILVSSMELVIGVSAHEEAAETLWVCNGVIMKQFLRVYAILYFAQFTVFWYTVDILTFEAFKNLINIWSHKWSWQVQGD